MEIKEKMVKLTIYAYYEVCEEFYNMFVLLLLFCFMFLSEKTVCEKEID